METFLLGLELPIKHILGMFVRMFQRCFGWGEKTHPESVSSYPMSLRLNAKDGRGSLSITVHLPFLNCEFSMTSHLTDIHAAWPATSLTYTQYDQPPHWHAHSMTKHLTDIHATWPATSLTCTQHDQPPHWHTRSMTSFTFLLCLPCHDELNCLKLRAKETL